MSGYSNFDDLLSTLSSNGNRRPDHLLSTITVVPLKSAYREECPLLDPGVDIRGTVLFSDKTVAKSVYDIDGDFNPVRTADSTQPTVQICTPMTLAGVNVALKKLTDGRVALSDDIVVPRHERFNFLFSTIFSERLDRGNVTWTPNSKNTANPRFLDNARDFEPLYSAKKVFDEFGIIGAVLNSSNPHVREHMNGYDVVTNGGPINIKNYFGFYEREGYSDDPAHKKKVALNPDNRIVLDEQHDIHPGDVVGVTLAPKEEFKPGTTTRIAHYWHFYPTIHRTSPFSRYPDSYFVPIGTVMDEKINVANPRRIDDDVEMERSYADTLGIHLHDFSR